jgi:hypothetical protein
MRRVILEILFGPLEGGEGVPGRAGLGQHVQPGRQLAAGHLHVRAADAPVAQGWERIATIPIHNTF